MTDWLVFGDDWGAHASTTQHLVRELLAAGDRVVWINGIGMRSPKLSAADGRRIMGRLSALVRGRGAGGKTAAPLPPGLRVVHPAILPWHQHMAPLNGALLRRPVRAALDDLGVTRAHVVISNPMAALYLDGLPLDRVIYLRLDDFAAMPLVDAAHVGALDTQLMETSDLVVATARTLLDPAVGERGRYLPQGVDLGHFGVGSLEIPAGEPRVLGFFGLLDAWIDVGLIGEVARRRPDWTLELLGRSRLTPAAAAGLQCIENVRFRAAVPYMDLPAAVRGWHAAWAPFALSRLTEGVNPLKLREYLALGLPTACTPLPEIAPLAPHCAPVRDADDVARWLDEVVDEDTPAARQTRRDSVLADGWGSRADLLREWAEGATT